MNQFELNNLSLEKNLTTLSAFCEVFPHCNLSLHDFFFFFYHFCTGYGQNNGNTFHLGMFCGFCRLISWISRPITTNIMTLSSSSSSILERVEKLKCQALLSEDHFWLLQRNSTPCFGNPPFFSVVGVHVVSFKLTVLSTNAQIALY